MQKDAVLIFDAFLNSSLRIEVFEKTLKSVQKLGLPIMVISNSKIPEYLSNQLDYFIYSKDNILFSDSYDKYPKNRFFMDHSYVTYIYEKEYKQKHGLSVLSNLKIASNFAESLGFKKFIRMEWDFIISEKNIDFLNKTINDFIKNDKRAFFLLNPYNNNDLVDISFWFWMVDIKFWNENFPNIHSEEQYKQFISHKNKENFFETAERILFLAFENKLTNDEFILEENFSCHFEESKINAIINDSNFDFPSDDSCCRGLTKIIKNGKITGQLALFTWNRYKKETDNCLYEIKFTDHEIKINHSVVTYNWTYSIIDNFDENKFPILLKVNDFFAKEYKNFNEICPMLIIK